MEKARRRHVPAFGEWNYYSSSSSPDEPEQPPRSDGDWWYAPEPAACAGDVVWLRYPSPRPRRPAPKKPRRPEAVAAAPETPRYNYGGGKQGLSFVVPAQRARGPDGTGAVAKKGARRAVVVRPVDEDLYQVPPPELGAPSWPRRKRAARRTLWMGCLGGLGCVA